MRTACSRRTPLTLPVECSITARSHAASAACRERVGLSQVNLSRVTPETTNAVELQHAQGRRGSFLASRFGLRFKLVALTTSIALVVIWLSVALLFNFQRQQLIKSTYNTAETLTGAIQVSLEHAMLTRDWEMVDQVLHAVAQEEAVTSVRIMGPNGKVRASTIHSEKGVQFGMNSAICQSCHAQGQALENRTIITNSSRGSQALLSVKAIENQPQCYTCHDPEQQLLGVMMLETPITALNDQLKQALGQSVFLGLIAFTLLVGILIPVLNRYVIQPIEVLSHGVAEIASGNLDTEVQEGQSDELGDLARSFNSMSRQLKSTYEKMARREQELAVLNDVGRAVGQLRSLQDILDFTLDTVLHSFRMAAGVIYLWDEDIGRCELQAARGYTQAQIDEIVKRRMSGYDIPTQVASSGKEELVVDVTRDARFAGIWNPGEPRSYLCLPLVSRGTVVGVMSLTTRPDRFLTEADVNFLKAVGWEVGIAIDNALLLDSAQQRERQAIALHELGTRISASLALSEVLDAVADAARELLQADIGLVGLLDDVQQMIVIRSVSGEPASRLRGERILLRDSDSEKEFIRGKPLLVEVYTPGQRLLHDLDHLPAGQVTSFLAVPLLRGDRLLGLIEVLALQSRRFQQSDAEVLQRLAQQVVVCIENAQLYKQLRFLATLEERDRLARELHDHLAQTLGYLNVKASMTADLVTDRKYLLALESLDELKRVAKMAYTDVREAIFNLRTTISASTSLLASLREYLAQYSVHYGLDAHLVIENDDADEFTPEVASQLLHIVQEALTNVRKHSQATRVLVRYDQSGPQIRVTIEDNGQGFVPEEVPRDGHQHVGLNIMRERAESIGGSLILDSAPGQGTRVIVSAPILLEE